MAIYFSYTAIGIGVFDSGMNSVFHNCLDGSISQ